MKIIKDLYRSYKQRCVENSEAYVAYNRFEEVHNKAKVNILKVASKNKDKSKIPICILPIDKDKRQMYWVEIRDEQAVVNFITKEQFEILFQSEINKGKHERK